MQPITRLLTPVLIVGAVTSAFAQDLGKSLAELPTKEVLAAPRSSRTAAGDANPRVAPGKVKWHPGFAAARTAAGTSGKPILHFQLLGRLDQEFC